MDGLAAQCFVSSRVGRVPLLNSRLLGGSGSRGAEANRPRRGAEASQEELPRQPLSLYIIDVAQTLSGFLCLAAIIYVVGRF